MVAKHGYKRPRKPEYVAKLNEGIELLKQGYTAAYAGRKVGVSPQVLSVEYKKQTGEKLSNNRKYFPPEKVKTLHQLVKRVEQGYAIKSVIREQTGEYKFTEYILRDEMRRLGKTKPKVIAAGMTWDRFEPVTIAAWKHLRDGKWHSYKETIQVAMKEIPPGVAIRWLEKRRVYFYTSRGREVPPRKRFATVEQQVYHGQYGKAQAIIRGGSTVETRKQNGVLEIRLKVETLPAEIRERLNE